MNYNFMFKKKMLFHFVSKIKKLKFLKLKNNSRLDFWSADDNFCFSGPFFVMASPEDHRRRAEIISLIVLEEESDEIEDSFISHFSYYKKG